MALPRCDTWPHAVKTPIRGSGIGGAAGGLGLLTGNPFIAGAIGGAVGNASRQGLKYATQDTPISPLGFATETTLGAATGWIPGLKIQGITAGRGSYLMLHRKFMTSFGNGTAKNVSASTAAKMAIGETTEKSVAIGGATSGALGTGLGKLSCADCENK